MSTRGLLQIKVDQGEHHAQGLFYLTSLGQDMAQQIADAGLGTIDAIAMRTLLRRFINLPGYDKLEE